MFWKREHKLKEIVNLLGLFVLIVAYVTMTTYPLTKYCYIIERVYYTYRLFVLFISTISLSCFCIQYHGGIREINSMPV